MEKLTINDIHEVEYNVLSKFAEICEENNLCYVLAYGTLLGAVRHEGFIPWDDDIDVWMPRNDYEKFLVICKNQQKSLKPYKVINFHEESDVPYTITRFSNMDYKLIYDKGKQFDSGIFVDIYPMDKLGSTAENAMKFYKKTYIYKVLVDFSLARKRPKRSSLTKTIVTLFLYPYAKMIGSVKMMQKLEKTSKMRMDIIEDQYYGCPMLPGYGIEKELYQKRFLYNRIKLKFEKGYFWVPENYEELLTHIYGDYMSLPPVEERDIKRHGYDAYKL